MISGFQSREFGLGLGDRLTEDILAEVNEKMKGEEYVSSDCAKLLFSGKYIKYFTDDPPPLIF